MSNDDTLVIESLVGLVRSTALTYSGSRVVRIDYYKSLTQSQANRIYTIDLTYSGSRIDTEVVSIYQDDGLTIFQTQTTTYFYSGNDLVKTEEVVS